VAIMAGEGAEEVARVLAAEPYVEAQVVDAATAEESIRRGDVALAVVPDAGGVRYLYDPSRSESRVARLTVNDALQRAAGRQDPRPTLDEPLDERGSRYIDFLMPGLIGMNLLGTGLWGVGYTVVRMRREQLIKRLVATPMRRGHFLLSFMLGRMVFLAAELALLLSFAWIVFDVTVQGSLLALLITAVIGAFAFTAIGLLVASRVRTIEAAAGLMNLAAIPMWIVSGIFFSYHHFPDAVLPIIRALPLTALVDALRSVMMDGASLFAVSGSLAVVGAWGLLAFAASLALFRWR